MDPKPAPQPVSLPARLNTYVSGKVAAEFQERTRRAPRIAATTNAISNTKKARAHGKHAVAGHAVCPLHAGGGAEEERTRRSKDEEHAECSRDSNKRYRQRVGGSHGLRFVRHPPSLAMLNRDLSFLVRLEQIVESIALPNRFAVGASRSRLSRGIVRFQDYSVRLRRKAEIHRRLERWPSIP